jgi:hypothetical protein
MPLTPSDWIVDHTETHFMSGDIESVTDQYETLLAERSTVMETVEELIKCRERLTLQIEYILREQRLKGAL